MVSVIQQAIEALEGVIRVADRATVEFDAAKAALASLRAAQEGDLPPLPKPRTLSRGDEDGALQLGYTADQMREYARTAIAAAGGGVPQAWISLEEQRPEPEVFVLAWDGKKVTVDWWGSLYRPHGTEYTHWMPFPTPPGVSGRSMYGMHSLASSPQPEAAQPNLVDDEGVMNTPLLRAARLLVSGSHPSKDCAGPYMVPADLWLTLQAEVMESLRQAAARDLANPAQPEAAPADDVLEALELSPETFRTEGGVINKGKLRAAILHPYNYLPPDHWMQARFSKPGGRPLSEAAPAVAQVPLEWRDWVEGVRDDILYPLAHRESDELSPIAEGLGQSIPNLLEMPAPESPAQAARSAGEVERNAQKLRARFDELLNRYWSLGHAEGKEGSNHDTEGGDAQITLCELHDLFRAALSHKEPQR